MEWLEDMEKTLREAELSKEESSRWKRCCIYRVPACIKDLNPRAYRPQLVSLGPYHHGNAELLPMEEHKRRALQHLLLRCAGPPAVKDFVAAVEDVLEELQSSYADLGAEWRGSEESRKRFVGMMVVDGCFLLEVMRAAGHHGNGISGDYVVSDPIFGTANMMPYIRRDMLMLENQLPVLLLQKLVAVIAGQTG